MYDIPSAVNVEKCIISRETVEGKALPNLIINENKKPLKRTMGRKARVKRESVS